jgi:hypothetical protein
MTAWLSGVSNIEFQRLAEARLADARTLFEARQLDGAYYLGGYAVECAIKAVIAKAVQASVLTPKGAIDRVYTHDLLKLMELAGLRLKLEQDAGQRPGLQASWAVAKQWEESRRYESGASLKTVEEFLEAVDGEEGVLTWLRQSW